MAAESLEGAKLKKWAFPKVEKWCVWRKDALTAEEIEHAKCIIVASDVK